VRETFSYYPGCWLDGSARMYGESVEAVFETLGVGLEELPGWNCCGAASARQVSPKAGRALAQSNLRIAAETGKPLVVPCAICYANLLAGRGTDGGRSVEVLHPLEVLCEPGALVELRARTAEPLAGFKVACYYGCLLTRPPAPVQIEDVDNPLAMERILEVLGAETVDWPAKTSCCGAALGEADEKSALELVGEIILSAEDAGANCIAVACPLCHRNLDVRQFEASRVLRRKIELPVFYFTELAAVAFDLPQTESWLKRHLTTVFPLIDEVLGFE